LADLQRPTPDSPNENSLFLALALAWRYTCSLLTKRPEDASTLQLSREAFKTSNGGQQTSLDSLCQSSAGKILLSNLFPGDRCQVHRFWIGFLQGKHHPDIEVRPGMRGLIFAFPQQVVLAQVIPKVIDVSLRRLQGKNGTLRISELRMRRMGLFEAPLTPNVKLSRPAAAIVNQTIQFAGEFAQKIGSGSFHVFLLCWFIQRGLFLSAEAKRNPSIQIRGTQTSLGDKIPNFLAGTAEAMRINCGWDSHFIRIAKAFGAGKLMQKKLCF
jgi:hypothetical protein